MRPSDRPRPIVRPLGIGLLVLLLAIATFGLYRWEQGNFGVVVPNEVYRSRQLGKTELTDVLTRYDIKSIVNLRGRNFGESWYLDEVAVAEQLNVKLYTLSLSTYRELGPADLDELEATLREAPKPLLIHCKSGADRTGLAAALYLYKIRNRPADEAVDQLSLYYGHIPGFLHLESSAMDRSFTRAQAGHP